MPLPLVLAGLGAASKAAGGIAGLFQGSKMLNQAKKINPFYEKYQTSRAASAMAGMAQTNLNAVNPSFGMQQRSIAGSQANAMAGVNRNVTDSSQALAMAAGLQGQSDQASANLGIQMDANRQQNMQNWMQAQNVLVGEDRFKYNDMMNKYRMDVEQKAALETAGRNAINKGIGQIGGAFTQAAGLANAHKNGSMDGWLSKQGGV